MDAEDARSPAANSGADALIVNNHGGRQLDGAPSSMPRCPASCGPWAGHRGVDGWRHPQRPGRAQGPRPGCAGHLISRAFLYGLGPTAALGVTRWRSFARAGSDHGVFAATPTHQHRGRGILLPGTYPSPVPGLPSGPLHPAGCAGRALHQQRSAIPVLTRQSRNGTDG